MESFWILGAGHFGSLAVKRILQSQRDCNVIVVDHAAEPLDGLMDRDLEIIQKDAIFSPTMSLFSPVDAQDHF